MKIIINKSYGGFGIKKEVLSQVGFKEKYPDDNEVRTNNKLIEMIENNVNINDRYSDLKVVEIPDDVDWIIEEYDGMEWIAEKHRTWE